MADYNLSYLRNRVLNDKLDDDTFDPDVVDNFLNDTQKEIFMQYELPFMEKTFAGLLPDGEHVFVFPTDYQLTQSLVIVDPSGYQRNITENYIGFRQFNSLYPTPGNNTPGTPLAWTLHGNKLYLDKPTDQEYTLQLFYIKTPGIMADDADVPDVPQQFEEIMILGAYWRCLERNEDFDLASGPKQDYTRLINNMLNVAGKRQSGTPVIIGNPRSRPVGRQHGLRKYW